MRRESSRVAYAFLPYAKKESVKRCVTTRNDIGSAVKRNKTTSMAASEGGKAGCYEGTNGVPRQGSARSTLHLGLSDAQIAPRILTCGSLPRARILATAFDGGKAEHEVSSERGFVSLHGRVGGVRVSVVASGMGFPMLDFLVREALAILPPYDGESARALIVRYGSCGSIAPEVREGCVVVNSLGSTAVARLPDAFGSSGHIGEICPYKVHAVVPSDGPLSSALERELRAALGEGAVASGLNVSACSFYSSQGREDPAFDDGHAAFDPIAVRGREGDTWRGGELAQLGETSAWVRMEGDWMVRGR